MKRLIFWIIFLLILGGGYLYFIKGVRTDNIDLKSLLHSGPKVDPATGKPLVACGRCDGTGLVKCTAPRCDHGKLECSGPCLKRSVGIWEHMDNPGHDPKELYRKFRDANNKGWHGFSTAHIGQVVEMKDGIAQIVGNCKICEGTGKVDCKVCKGTGMDTCPTCHGSKAVPDASALVKTSTPKTTPNTARTVSTPFSTPVPKKPEAIRLKNGQTIMGNITIADSEITIIKTPDGKSLQVPTANLVTP